MIEIITRKRSDDWHACLAVNPGFWGCGRTEQEAIGSLVKTMATGKAAEVKVTNTAPVKWRTVDDLPARVLPA